MIEQQDFFLVLPSPEGFIKKYSPKYLPKKSPIPIFAFTLFT